jgi:uncharacterized protein
VRILITGGTGLIGANLSNSLISDGHSVVTLSRDPRKVDQAGAEQAIKWEPEAGPPPREAFTEVDAIVHLAGEPIAGRRWTPEQKRRIRDSRVVGTRNLVEGLRSLEKPPAVLISGSAVGIYGDRGDEKLDESASPGKDFLSEVCQQWEQEAMRASEVQMRVIVVRTGVVLTNKGGALKQMSPMFRMGIGGRLGEGNQWFPWIHLEDELGLLRLAITSNSIRGPINAVAPGIVTNKEFTKQFAAALHRPAFVPAPAFALRIALGEMADVLLGSQRVVPRVALDAGYHFRFPELAGALASLIEQENVKEG